MLTAGRAVVWKNIRSESDAISVSVYFVSKKKDNKGRKYINTKKLFQSTTGRLGCEGTVSNVPSKSLLNVRRVKGRVSSAGYSNLGTRGKDFQKLMCSKKKRSLNFLSQNEGVL